jgi:hypothetical protein
MNSSTSPQPASPDPASEAPDAALHAADAAFIATLPDVVAVHANESHWWNHASFALPLLGCIGFVAWGWLGSSAEALGFGLFLGAITVFMLPVVMLTWRGTPTAIVLTRTGAYALHDGHTLREVQWAGLDHIDRVETMGNIRWRLVPREGQHLAIEGEIADVPGLVARARELAQLPDQ